MTKGAGFKVEAFTGLWFPIAVMAWVWRLTVADDFIPTSDPSARTNSDFEIVAIPLATACSQKAALSLPLTNVSTSPPPASLASVRIHFHTTDDDKDGDTHVTTIVFVGGNPVASAAGKYGHWNDNCDSGWISLRIIEGKRKNEVLGSGILKIIEAPNGNDEWHFHYTLELIFSDGEMKRFDGEGNVNQDRTTITRGL